MFVLNVVDGCIPSDLGVGTAEDIEEERRLLYVAMTRAKDHLMLLLPQRFYAHQQARNGDRHVYASRSRFIPAAITAHFEHQIWPRRALATAGVAPATGVTVDLNARMRGMWQRSGT